MKSEFGEPTALAPTGRETVTGTILSLKTVHYHAYGTSALKMTVLVDNREWCGSKVFVTATPGANVGDRITFMATFERKPDDPSFAFGKRPKLLVCHDAADATRTTPDADKAMKIKELLAKAVEEHRSALEEELFKTDPELATAALGAREAFKRDSAITDKWLAEAGTKIDASKIGTWIEDLAPFAEKDYETIKKMLSKGTWISGDPYAVLPEPKPEPKWITEGVPAGVEAELARAAVTEAHRARACGMPEPKPEPKPKGPSILAQLLDELE